MKSKQCDFKLPFEALVLNEDEMLVIKGGRGMSGSGDGCGCKCANGEGCGCKCGSEEGGKGCGCKPGQEKKEKVNEEKVKDISV